MKVFNTNRGFGAFIVRTGPKSKIIIAPGGEAEVPDEIAAKLLQNYPKFLKASAPVPVSQKLKLEIAAKDTKIKELEAQLADLKKLSVTSTEAVKEDSGSVEAPSAPAVIKLKRGPKPKVKADDKSSDSVDTPTEKE